MRSILDADLAAMISPTEQYSDLSDKELDCPFNVRCQMHGQGHGAGREYALSNHGPSLKSATLAVRLPNQMRASSFGDTRLWWGTDRKMSRDLMSSRPNGRRSSS